MWNELSGGNSRRMLLGLAEIAANCTINLTGMLVTEWGRRANSHFGSILGWLRVLSFPLFFIVKSGFQLFRLMLQWVISLEEDQWCWPHDLPAHAQQIWGARGRLPLAAQDAVIWKPHRTRRLTATNAWDEIRDKGAWIEWCGSAGFPSIIHTLSFICWHDCELKTDCYVGWSPFLLQAMTFIDWNRKQGIVSSVLAL